MSYESLRLLNYYHMSIQPVNISYKNAKMVKVGFFFKGGRVFLFSVLEPRKVGGLVTT